MAETRLIKIKEICTNDGQIPGVKKNPRCIKGEKFEKLCKIFKTIFVLIMAELHTFIKYHTHF